MTNVHLGLSFFFVWIFASVVYLKFRHNFVSLQVEMKGIFTKIIAVLLVVWYSMSIIGFDVHTCSGSGRSFVVTFVEGLTCEEIHPEHRCDKSACCADAHGCCQSHGCTHSDSEAVSQISARSCCSSDYQVLALTGTSLDDKDNERNVCNCGHCPSPLLISVEMPDNILASGRIFFSKVSGPGVEMRPDGQSLFSVWRI